MARRKKQTTTGAGGAPDYMVTYGDMMSLLLCFFVILVSMSEVKKDDRFFQVMESLRVAFGNKEEIREFVSDKLEPNALLKTLQNIVIPGKMARAEADDPGIRGKFYRVTDVRDGVQVEIGGRITFAPFSANLEPEAESLIAQTAEKTIGHNTIIMVTGHATNEPVPADSAWRDPWDLSYARARAVKEVLVGNGIREARIRMIAAGAEAPLQRQAYTEEEWAVNRRVEIVMTEATVEDFLPGEHLPEKQEPTDG